MPDIIESADAAAGTGTAYTLQIGQTARGFLVGSADHDWYRVHLTAGRTYVFAMTGTGSANVVDPFLNLYGPDGTTVLASDDDSLPNNNSLFTYTAASTGDFYIDASAYTATDTSQYEISVSEGTIPSFDIEMAAGVIDADYAWNTTPGTPATVTYGFRQSPATYTVTGSNIGSFTRLSATEIAAVQTALQFWSDVCGLTFNRVNPGGYANNASILFGNYTDGTDGAGAFAFYPGSTDFKSDAGDVWLNTTSISTTGAIGFGSYSLFAIIHEIGHSLGLSHPGLYNAAPGVSITYDANAQFVEDSQQYSVMSYFDESNTGGQFLGYADTPMLADVYAAQQIYGANMATRAGDTVYGFNTNAGAVYDFAANADPAFCVWDAGGADTIDASGYAMAQSIDLRQGAFSNIGGLTSNVSIAIGAVIEDAIGGSGADTITGNDSANLLIGAGGADWITGGAGDDTLRGGAGSDTLDGGAGQDTADFTDLSDALDVNLATGTALDAAAGATDTLVGVENVALGNGANVVRLASGAINNIIRGGSGIDSVYVAYAWGSGYTLTGTAGDLVMSGADGVDEFTGVEIIRFTDGIALSPTLLLAPPVAGSVTISDASITEGDSGTKILTFTVTRTGGLAPFGVAYATADGAATAGSDYVAATGTLMFAAGVNSQTIAVTVNGDYVVEPDETFVVNLSGATNGATIADTQGVGTIVNDDAAGSVTISDASITECDSGTKILTFTVTRTGGLAPFGVAYATADGTATAGSDYVAATGTLMFAAGVNTQTVSVAINGDYVVEPDETFFVNLSGATNGATIKTARGNGIILNDDFADAGPFTTGDDVVTLTTPGKAWRALDGNDVVTGTRGADSIAGDGGDDTLSGGDEGALSQHAQSVYRLYLAAFNRDPDLAGLAWWTRALDGGASLASVAANFVNSTEFSALYGAPGDAAFAQLLYRNVLHRAPDAAGLAGWVAALGSGEARADVLAAFSESPENIGATAASERGFATGSFYNAFCGEVYRLYGAAFGRDPDVAGFEAWTDALANGASLADVTAGFTGSAEFHAIYGSPDNTAFVTLLYNNALGRTPDAAGLAAWTRALDAGATRESVVDGISESAEYVGRTAASLEKKFMQTALPARADTLDGGAGNDVLFGGRGADTFRFDLNAPGSDQIYGFESWDVLSFASFGYVNAAQAASHMTQSGVDVVFADRGETVTFHDTGLAVVAGASILLK